jgi:hypothetical protein
VCWYLAFSTEPQPGAGHGAIFITFGGPQGMGTPSRSRLGNVLIGHSRGKQLFVTLVQEYRDRQVAVEARARAR